MKNTNPQWNRPKEIVFIRHGESERQAIKGPHFYLQDPAAVAKLSGKYDHEIALTKKGHRQASQSGPKIFKAIGRPDYIYHSGYVRARETMEGLLNHLRPEQRKKIEIRESIKLRERDPGYTWHMTEGQVNGFFPWHAEYRCRVGPLFYRPPGGESIIDVYNGRLYDLLQSIIRDRPGKVVWLVCHGHVIRAARILMERLSISRAQRMVEMDVPNVSVTRYVYEGPSSTKPTRTHLNKVYWKGKASAVLKAAPGKSGSAPKHRGGMTEVHVKGRDSSEPRGLG